MHQQRTAVSRFPTRFRIPVRHAGEFRAKWLIKTTEHTAMGSRLSIQLRISRAWPLLIAALLLASCSSSPRTRRHSDDEIRTGKNSTSRPVSLAYESTAAPAGIASALAGLAGRASSTSIEWRQMELALDGSRLVMARGTGPLCKDENCPYGLFARRSGAYEPLFLAMGSREPQVYSVGHLGYPGLTTTSVASEQELKVTRFQWDGATYSATSCRLVDRISSQSRGCDTFQSGDVPVLDSAPENLCLAVRRIVSTPPQNLRTSSVIARGFVIRSDEAAHVEGIKIRGDDEQRTAKAIARCLQSMGSPLQRAKRPASTDGLTTQGWFGVSGASRQSLSISTTSTYVPHWNFTLVSVGVFTSARPQSAGDRPG